MIDQSEKTELQENRQVDEKPGSYTGLGIAFGASLGLLLGLLLFEGNNGLGIGIGVALGLIIGSIIDAQKTTG